MNFSRLVIFLMCWNFTNARKKPALVFDWENEKLVEISKFDDKVSCKYCINACPAASNSSSEKLLNDKISITKKSLFLRNVYHKNNGLDDTFANEMEIEICKDSYTPTIVWNYWNKTYEVGYELYHERRLLNYKMYPSFDYDSFFHKESKKSSSDSSIEENELPDEEDLMETDTNEKNESFEIKTGLQELKLTDDLGDESIQQKIEASAENLVKITEATDYTAFEIIAEPEKKWFFYWISVLSITVSNDQKHRYISFNADESNDYFHKVRTIYYCKTYFGKDGEEIENTDGPENDFGIQVFDTKPEMEEKTKEFGDRLVKTQIIPMRMFHTMAARLATCVYLNFAFIWETIANGILKKIDLFVYAIYRERFQWMDIYFGVYGDVEELNPVTEKQISKDNIFSKHPVPKVIFRVIRMLRLNGMHYGVVIVIHNTLTSVKDSDRVCSTKDEVEGWNDIKNMDNATGFSYTCPDTEEVTSKLGFDEDFVYMSKNNQPLKLNKFPKRIGQTRFTEYINFLDSVKKRLERIEKLKIQD